MGTSLELKAEFPISAEELYEYWLDGELHGEMTFSEATGTPEVGASFTAWDDYVSGKNLELVPNSKIVQSWRTTDFDDNDPDSTLEIQLRDTDNGCEMTLIHTGIPNDQPDYKEGWEEFYIKPMTEYFSDEFDEEEEEE